jgi:hypothetical protein
MGNFKSCQHGRVVKALPLEGNSLKSHPYNLQKKDHCAKYIVKSCKENVKFLCPGDNFDIGDDALKLFNKKRI